MKSRKAQGWSFIVKATIGLLLLFILILIVYYMTKEGSAVADKIRDIF